MIIAVVTAIPEIQQATEPGALTLEEVGQQFSVTRERIRQIEAKALRKMRHPTRIRQLHGFFEADQSSVNKPKPEALRQLGL